MSMPKINIINYSNEWIGICSNFGDIEDQKKVWFRCEGPEVGSYGSDYAHMDFVLNAWPEAKRKELLNQECYDLIQEFLEKLYKFREDPQTDFILAEEEELHSDPRWLMIVRTAQEAKVALETYIKEIENDTKR